MFHRETIAAPVLDEKDDEVDQVTNALRQLGPSHDGGTRGVEVPILSQ